jgi:hypothetical protein
VLLIITGNTIKLGAAVPVLNGQHQATLLLLLLQQQQQQQQSNTAAVTL